jgi:hypothetical protein
VYDKRIENVEKKMHPVTSISAIHPFTAIFNSFNKISL